MAYPAQSTITSNGDYVADIAYNIVKSGDGFTDESLEVLVNGVSVGSTVPNTSNRLGNLTINEDNEWVVTIVYTASYNGNAVTAISNNLTFITRNTSGGGNASGNSSDNETGDNPQPSGIQVIIRDSANPNSNVININEKTNIVLEYYVTVPEGDVISSDLIIYCNGEVITTVTPADKKYSNIGGSIFLNETGDYVFTAIYKYVIFMGDYGEVSGNSVTYHVTISNETPEITPELSIIIQDVFYPNPLTAIIKSNVDGLYTIRIGENTYDVSVNGGRGSTTFTLPADTYTAEIVSNTNSSLKNSTTFTVYPKSKTAPVVATDVLIDNGKATIKFNFPADINDEKLTVTLNGKTTKETTINNGEAVVEFDGLDDGDYSYQFFYAGNDDYQMVNNAMTFTVESSVISNDTGNGTDTNSSGAGNESQSDSNSSLGNSNQSGSVIRSIVAEDLNRGQGSSYDFKAIFYDKNGNLLTNAEVNFIVNGNDNIVKTDEYGVAKFSNKLDAGTYEIKIRNFATGEVISKSLTIVKRITGNKDIKVDYSYSANYRIRLYADNGNVVGAGENIVITLNNVRYNVGTDKNGYATFKVNGLLPKTYTITAEYKGVNVSNKVVVKKLLLKAKNTKFKKAKKVKKYKVTLKTSAGKAIKGKKISLNVKGKTYSGKTNAKGSSLLRLKILKKWVNTKLP